MKMNKLLLVAITASSFAAINASAAVAPDQGSGTVTFVGSIIDAPCSISPESSNQTVDLGQVSNALLSKAGSSTPRNFSIDLEKCDTTTKKNVTITFGGSKDSVNDKLLGITGSAKGAGVVLTDGSGTQITLDAPSAARNLLAGNNKLVFSAYLQGNTAEGEVTPGEFTSVANFTLTYP
ncbi:fimbrial protein [Providencia rettgeri]|uniref:fimbrial protein n=1 Tax=Providencia rettgeri TaxID=587 RepID=UPI00029C6425|nr:fimbrial protein [Providencia rettgeri]EKT57790.1 fimbrial protein domain-containing protein [Providencia rettgeri Dmel1]